MRTIFIFTILVFCSFLANAQGWQWSHPKPQGNTLNSVCFTDANTGYAVGAWGTILKTTDVGITWESQVSGTTESFESVCFPAPDTGFAVGRAGTILKTTDGGTTWDIYASGNHVLYSVHFTGSDTGYAVGFDKNTYHGLVLKTTDGGVSWTGQTWENTYHLTSFCFTDANQGYAVGWYGIILKTSDTGITWNSLSTIRTVNSLMSVCFPVAETGYAVGDLGTILKTTDGGATWNHQASGTNSPLTSVCFTNSDNGFAVGWYGTILLTTDGGGVGVSEPEQLSRLKIYPNPAHDRITMKIKPETGTGYLKIINTSGQELLYRKITSGKTLLDISKYPNGVYFVRLILGQHVETGKFIKK